jgi:hypothetical protein
MFPLGDDNSQRHCAERSCVSGRIEWRTDLHPAMGVRAEEVFRGPRRAGPHHLHRDVHAWGWLHLFGNMLYLWIFGDNVEDEFGPFKFRAFYLLCGVAATLAQYYVSTRSGVPNVGASGAIAGVLAAYLLMFPGARVNVLVYN